MIASDAQDGFYRRIDYLVFLPPQFESGNLVDRCRAVPQPSDNF